MFHYFVTTVKIIRTFRLDSYKDTTLKQRTNIAKAAYKMDCTRYGWADLFFSPHRVKRDDS